MHDAAAFRVKARWLENVQSAARRVTRRVVAATLAIASALGLWTLYEFAFDGAATADVPPLSGLEFLLSGAVINLVMAFTLMFATFVADEFVANGARRRIAYSCAMLAGSAVGALMQKALRHWLHLASRYDAPGVPPDISVMQPAVIFFEYLIWGSIVVFIYVNRRTALQAAARMSRAQTEQARARRRTLESRLQALQARIEPQFLFNTLSRVKVLYRDDPEKGGRLLEGLIVYLRAALPRLRDSLSTLAKEIDLVRAYMSIMQAHAGERAVCAVDVSVPSDARDAAFPPMVLLPLVDQVLGMAGPAGASDLPPLRIVARVVARRLRVEISAPGDIAAKAGRGVVPDIRERLRALYGELGTLVVDGSRTAGGRIVMEIPHETADRDHR